MKHRGSQTLVSAPVTHMAPLSSLELECPCEVAQAGKSESAPAHTEACSWPLLVVQKGPRELQDSLSGQSSGQGEGEP